jgi:phosphatidylserine decarboxylase
MNSSYPHPIIAREGWPFLAIAFIVAAVLTWLGWTLLAVLAWTAFAFVLQFFRDPARTIPQAANAVLSPADGRIVVVENVRDPYLERDALKISVFMNVFNVHSNRSPIKSTVQLKWYKPGSYLNASLAKASLENERCALHLKTDDGRDITCVQIAGLIARRILNYVDVGTALAAGQRYGFIRFGSRVDVYVPLDSRVKVVIGDKVSASSCVLAELS